MVIVLMGVAGSGKTRVGHLLARELGWPFYDGDLFHPASNIAKMSRGVPLDDIDRRPWLEALHALVKRKVDRREHAIVACSAMKERYRALLKGELDSVRFVYLKGTSRLLEQRLAERDTHFMKPGMLASQLATLEEPTDALTVDISHPPEAIVATIGKEFGL